MVVTVSPSDPRSVKALEILASAGQWLKVRTHDGKKLYGVPAACEPGRYYLVDCFGCDCQDSLRRLERGDSSPCKHRMAVILHCARVNGAKAQREQARQSRAARKTLCAACNGTSPYHMAKCPGARRGAAS